MLRTDWLVNLMRRPRRPGTYFTGTDRSRRTGRRLTRTHPPACEMLEVRQMLDASAPALVNGVYELQSDGSSYELDVLDGQPDGATIASVSNGSLGGHVEVSADGRALNYTPFPGTSGTETFFYALTVGEGAAVGNTTQVTAELQSPAENDSLTVIENSDAVRVDVLANDMLPPDYDGPGVITAVSFGSSGGDVEITDDGLAVIYQPAPDGSGIEQFAYIIDDTFAATVSVEIERVVDDRFVSFDVAPGGTFAVQLPDDDIFTDEYSGPRQITSVAGAEHGTVAVGSDGSSLVYTPGSGLQNVTDSVGVTFDGRYAVLVSFHIGDATANDNVSLDAGSTDFEIDVLANDPIQNGLLPDVSAEDIVITAVSEPSQSGRVQISGDGRRVIYSSPDGFLGVESFTYTVTGGYESTVFVDLSSPVRKDFESVLQDGGESELDVLANDFLGNGTPAGPRVITAVSEPGRGTVRVSDDGSRLLYTPEDGFTGQDSFTYEVNGETEANVSVRVESRVQNDRFAERLTPSLDPIGLPVLDNDRAFQSGANGTITAVTQPTTGGVVEIASDGRSLIFVSDEMQSGSIRFTYTVDGDYEATVVLRREASVRLNTDSGVMVRDGEPLTLQPLSNDDLGTAIQNLTGSDYPFPGLITSLGPTTEGGTATLESDGLTVTYTPAAGFVGTDTFEYTVDGRFTGTVRVTVNPPLRLNTDHLTVDQNSDPVVFDVLRNDQSWSQPDRRFNNGTSDNPFPGTITAVSATEAGGTVTIAADGRTVLYTPPTDFHGQDVLTYTVDGEFTETVQVNVIRRARDDQAAVLTGSSDNVIHVLANDPLSADYSGAGVITAVSVTEHGGTVVINEDGRTIRYTRADGFTGTDSFTYTVDGRQHAAVTVEVVSSVADLVERFESLDAFRDWLIEDALVRYDHLFGQEHTPIPWFLFSSMESAATGAVTTTSTLDTNFSETNVQVAGVDEADLIENDGEHLYVLSGSELVVLKAFPSDELTELARVRIDGLPVGMYLHEDRLTIVSRLPQRFPPFNRGTVDVFRDLPSDIAVADTSTSSLQFAGGFSDIIWPGPVRSPTSEATIVTVLDVSDPSAPQFVQQTTLDGDYRESRSIDGMLHLVVQSSPLQLSAPRLLDLPEPELDFDDVLTSSDPTTDGSSGTVTPAINFVGLPPDVWRREPTGIYETRDEYTARITASFDQLLDELLPGYVTVNADGTVLEGRMIDPTQIVRIEDSPSSPLVTVVSLDTRGGAAAPVAAEALLTSSGREIYATAEHLYLFQTQNSQSSSLTAGDTSYTAIYQFDWNSDVGGIDLAGTGSVAGRLLDQFSADEHDGRLRIVTSTSRSTPTGTRAVTDLTVFENRAGLLQPVGSELDIARGSQLKSVRFFGDRAFTATFQATSPLSVIDLSDPLDPELLGEVRSIGTPTYMQPIDASHLLTVGRSTVGFGVGATQVSLYDVSDPTQPLLIDRDALPRFSTSLAEGDHHAFGWFGFHQTLAIPTSRSFSSRIDHDGDGFRESNERLREDILQTFRIDTSFAGRSEDAIVLSGSVEHDSAILRAAFINDVLYSIGDRQTKAVSINDPDQLIAEVTYETDVIDLPIPIPLPRPGDPFIIQLPDNVEPPILRLRLNAVNFAGHPDRVGDAGNGAVELTTDILRAGLAEVTDGTLSIDATSLPDARVQILTDGATNELVVRISNAGNAPIEQRFDATDLTLVRVTTGDSDDRIDLTGLSIAAEVHSGGGDDTVRGGRSDDTVDGGTGDDMILGRAGRDLLRGGDGNDTIKGGRHNDTLEGGDGDDMIFGRAGRDLIRGGAGDDDLRGGARNDTLDGGTGTDILNGGAGRTVVIDEVAGNVTIQDNRYWSDRGDRARSSGPISRLILTGSAAADRFDASARTRTVEIHGGSGDDLVIGSSANDNLQGDAGDDTLRGGAGRDRLSGGDGDDNVRGEGDVDTLSGGKGNDLLHGGGGRSVLEEAADSDITIAGFGRETTLEGLGQDRLVGFYSAAVLRGGPSDNSLDASRFGGRATLLGGSGSDRLFGAQRPGRLVGGPGADELMPGTELDDIPPDAADIVHAPDSAIEPVSEDAINDAMQRLQSGA